MTKDEDEEEMVLRVIQRSSKVRAAIFKAVKEEMSRENRGWGIT